jgi:FtsH-binding integral membrane protein
MDTQLTNDNQQQDTTELKISDNNERNSFSFFSTDFKLNVVDKIDAPELYSRRAIYFFTIFCSVFFGGTLMFLNLRKMKNKQGQIIVAIYSILYGVISFTILAQFQRNTILTLLVSMIGSFPLYNYFWGKYVGTITEYKAKSIWIPLIIALVILGLFLIVVLTNIESFK